jgi:hypothetical protein
MMLRHFFWPRKLHKLCIPGQNADCSRKKEDAVRVTNPVTSKAITVTIPTVTRISILSASACGENGENGLPMLGNDTFIGSSRRRTTVSHDHPSQLSWTKARSRPVRPSSTI